MHEAKIRKILQAVNEGATSLDEAVESLKNLPYCNLGYAKVDHHRTLRLGFPEVILGSCKTAAQIAAILEELAREGNNVLVTRVNPALAQAVQALAPFTLEYHEAARVVILRQGPPTMMGRGTIIVITAGTGDIPVAEEACITAELMGNQVERLYDVGVAGIHRVLDQRDRLEKASVLIVVAGMEGALASVVGGLVPRPVIAVPTSIGYGASFSGIAALLGMLNSCAAGVSVVNIDNGFGAAYVASLINRPYGSQGKPHEPAIDD
jgi:NCAIR mutase (PurE)-related protein